jgi:two-component sensor histidine kinase
MGLKLIRLFAAQLQGVLEFAKQPDEGGTVITLTIARLAQSRCAPDR